MTCSTEHDDIWGGLRLVGLQNPGQAHGHTLFGSTRSLHRLMETLRFQEIQLKFIDHAWSLKSP